MRIDIITLFPNMFAAPIGESIVKIAQEKGKLELHIHDLRSFAKDKRKTTDDRPFGGGPGMVMLAEPLFDAIEAVKKLNPGKVIFLTPHGERLVQAKAIHLSQSDSFILLCGHYEGIDHRVREALVDEELSIGDFVLSGGEIPAMVVIDAVARLLPGVLGDDTSTHEESFSEALEGKKEYPQYTRPAEFRGMKVPDILLSGDHEKIRQWRMEHTM